jgi:recombination protein RecA
MTARVQQIQRLLSNARIRRAGEGAASTPDSPGVWSRDELSGRLTEISGSGATASLTATIDLVVGAQAQGEPVAWITLSSTTFYPPDAADSGVDLDALAVVRAPSAADAGRAADRLVRSGAFGLVIIDLGRQAEMSIAMQGRLVGLAQKHDTAIICLTEKASDSASLGSMVSLRAEVVREAAGEGHFRCKVKVLKDKRRGPGWSHTLLARGPDGLR